MPPAAADIRPRARSATERVDQNRPRFVFETQIRGMS